MTTTRGAVDRFVEALAASDLAAVTALYAPTATWEVHVPDCDGQHDGPDAIAALMDPWFTGRDSFKVVRHRVIGDGPTLALQWELHWRDDPDGAPCISHQTHVFEVDNGLIQRHWLYCSGVRVHEHTNEFAPSETARVG